MRKCYTFLLASLCLSLHLSAQNTSLSLTGSNYVTSGVDVIDPTGDFTVEFWAFIPQTMNDGNIHTLISEGSTGFAFTVGYAADGTIQLGDPAIFPSTGVPMTFDAWTHFALSYNSVTTIASLYVNGKLKTNLGGFFFNDDQPFRIGVQTDLSQPTVGKIDEVKAWGTTRSQFQIKGDMFGTPDVNDNNLIAWYKMDDASGTSVANSANSTGNSQNGAISGDPGGTNSWTASPIQFGSNSLVFDGVDDQVNIPALADNSYDLAGGGTVEFWVNPTTLSSSWATVLGNRGTGGVRYSFHLSATQIGLDNGSAINTLDYAVPAGTSNWTHLAFVMDDAASTTTVYVNGLQQGTIPGALGTIGSQPLTLGIAKNTSGPDDKPFNGGIDEVRIWNVKRNSSDILANKDMTLTGTESGLIGQFSFDQGISNGNDAGLTTAFDNSSNVNNGAISNFALSGTTSNFTTHTLIAAPLPITLTGFTATRSGSNVVLQWQTATEEHTSDFILQRSPDGKTYTDIGTVAAAGNSQALVNYIFTDLQPLTGNNFYRLKQTDLDGTYNYSSVRLISFPTADKLLWYVAGKGSVEVRLQHGNNEPYSLFDSGGRLLRADRLVNGATQITQLPPGIYFVRVSARTITIALP